MSRSRIILVDPGTNEGRQFVRDWGVDQGKVVLNYVWAYHCMDAGRALLENDNYGGFGELDGTPLDGDLDDEDKQEGPSTSTSHSHRSTAAKPKKLPPHLKAIPRDSASSSSSSSALPTPSPSMLTPRPIPSAFPPSQSPQAMHSTNMSSHYTPVSNQIPRQYSTPPATASPMIPPYFPKPVRPPSTTPTQVHEGLPYQVAHAMQPPPQPPPIPPASNPYEVALLGSHSYTNPMQQQLMNLMSNPELMSAAMSMLQQQMVHPGGMNNMNPHNGAVATPATINTSQAWPALPQPMGLLQTAPGFLTSMSPTQHYQQSPFSNEGSRSQSIERERVASPPVTVKTEPNNQSLLFSRQSGSPTVSDDDLNIYSQSGKRRSSDSGLLQGSISKRAKRDAEHRSSSLSQTVRSKEHKKRSSKHGPVELQIETLTPQEPKRSQVTSTGVFTGYNGKPIPFFVQVDMRNRVHVTGMIKVCQNI